MAAVTRRRKGAAAAPAAAAPAAAAAAKGKGTKRKGHPKLGRCGARSKKFRAAARPRRIELDDVGGSRMVQMFCSGDARRGLRQGSAKASGEHEEVV